MTSTAKRQTQKTTLSPIASKSIRRSPIARVASANAITWDFEDAAQFDEFTTIDNDGDGFNWYYHSNLGLSSDLMTPHGGDGLICSESYHNDTDTPLSPDNWLISPEVTLGGALSFYAACQDEDVPGDVFAVYVCVGDHNNDVSNFVQVGTDFTATAEYVLYEIDLSAYQGQVGHFAIVHHNVSDKFILNIDDITFDVEGKVLPYPTSPVVTVDPAAVSADVTWSEEDGAADKWNLRYRPIVDLSENPIDCDFSLDDYMQDVEGWQIYDADGDGNNWRFTYSNSAHTDACLMSESWSFTTHNALNPDNWLFSPETKLEGELRFTYWDHSDGGKDHLMVYAVVGTDTTALATEDYVATDEHQEVTIDLGQFDGQIGQIAFRHYNCPDEWALYLDNIFIGDPDNIAVPADWIEVNGLTSPNYTIEGLTPATEYEVQVMAYNDDHQSDWSEIVQFTTLTAGLGDVNRDGTINIADVTALIDIILGKDDVESYKYDHIAADTNRDTAISIADVIVLVNYLLGSDWPELTYTVVGPEAVFGSDWDEASEANNLVKGDDGVYTWKKEGVTLSGDNFEFKIVGNHHSSIYQCPEEGNYVANITEGEGKYDITITFNPNAAEADRISCTLTKQHIYNVVGEPSSTFKEYWEPSEYNQMEKGADGIYTWTTEDYFTAGTDIYFKVIQDHDTNIAWPEEGNDFRCPEKGWWFNPSESGGYRLKISFNPVTHEITNEVTRLD